MLKGPLLILVLIAGIGLPLALYLSRPPAKATGRRPAPPPWQLPEPLEARAEELSLLPDLPRRGSGDKASLTLRPHRNTAAAEWLTLKLAGPAGELSPVPLGSQPRSYRELGPGTWTVSIYATPASPEKQPLWQGRITLTGGEQKTIDLPALPGATLTGSVKGATGIKVLLRTALGAREAAPDGKGRFTFSDLPAGPALLQARAPAATSRWLETTLIRGRVTRLDPIDLGR